MSRLLIRGGNRLQGEVTIQGAKNSVLPILAATILTGGSVELRRCPRLRDVEASIRILQALGCKAGGRGDVLEVDTAGMAGCAVPAALLREKGLSTDVAIASDNFHQLRAAIWAQRSGLTPYSDGCASPWFLTAGYWARETAALLYMVVTGS